MIRLQRLQDAFGHRRERRELDFVDFAAHQREFFFGRLQDDALVVLAGDQAVENAAVGHAEDRHAEVFVHDGAGVDDVVEQIVEIVAAGAGEVGGDRAAGAEEAMAVGAGGLEDGAAVACVGGGERLFRQILALSCAMSLLLVLGRIAELAPDLGKAGGEFFVAEAADLAGLRALSPLAGILPASI